MDNNNNKKNKNKKKRSKRYDIERMVIYAVSMILLALVISLAVKNYRLESKLDKLSGGDAVATGTTVESDKAGNDKSDKAGSTDATQSTETALPLTVQGDVQYVDIDVPQKENQENYNGDDLEDNGYPYAIKINRQENIVTVYTLDAAGYYTVPVRAMRCSVSPIGETPSRTFQHSD